MSVPGNLPLFGNTPFFRDQLGLGPLATVQTLNGLSITDQVLSITGGSTTTMQFANGTLGAPSIAFASEPTLGLYRVSSGTLGITGNATVGGTLTIGDSSVQLSNLATGYLGVANTGGAVVLRLTAGAANGNASLQLYPNGSGSSTITNGGSTVITFPSGTNNTVVGGNLTVSGTGTSTFGGKIQSSVATATGYNQLYDTTGITTGRGAFAITSTGAGLAFGIESSAGGTSFTGSTAYASYFGTTTATPIHLVTNSSISATLTSGGNLGLGTTTPNKTGLSTMATVNGGTSAGYEVAVGDTRIAGFYAASTVAVLNAFANVPLDFSTNNTTRARLTEGGNYLLGTTTDSGNGKLQLATHTTSAGGIGFGTSNQLYTVATGSLWYTSAAAFPTLKISDDGTGSYSGGVLAFGDGNSSARYVGLWRGAANSLSSSGNYLNLGAYSGIVFTVGSAQIGSQTTALTLDSSQNATFAGSYVQLSNPALPNLQFYASSDSTDQKYWDIQTGSGTGTDGVWRLRAINDARSNGINAIVVKRSGISSVTINFPNLPTSASGLSAGDIWNDSGTLKIV